jgi:hypothetical protein
MPRSVVRAAAAVHPKTLPNPFGLAALLAGLAATLLLLGCNRSPSAPEAELSFQTLAKTTVAGVSAPRIREVVRDRARFEEAWSQLWGSSAAAAPAVDFEREMVVVASAGQVCFDVAAVERIKLEGSELLIELVEAVPSLCLCARPESTFHIVRLRRFHGADRFVARTVPPTCPS